ncbi:MAG: hypothetical protein CME19_03045 [Gemmatimonadetes bacterium]|nr:hypothetical protein [Gemmatimonadota bacterium]|tara:strand:+ start:1074 stop:2132 length:1059 start_codon:yes stop_codon:yes gene_type:complete
MPVDYRDCDRQVWEEELAEFVPDQVFDAHCHLFWNDTMKPGADFSPRSEANLTDLQEWGEALFPGRPMSFLILGMPKVGTDVDKHNARLAEQVALDPGSRANLLVTPECNVDRIRENVDRHGFIGLKPYRVFSSTGDINNCRIHEFLPHEQMELANDLGCWVTMHLSRSQGCADEHNLNDLAEYTTKRYPRIKWILAHCARSFTYYPIQQAVDRLRDMPNIWYDLSAVTTLRPFITLFQKEKLERIFYGSDGIDSAFFHGKYVPFGRYWFQVYPDNAGFSMAHTDARPILCIYEQLLAMKQAAEVAELSAEDIEGIFWRNAVTALEIERTQPEPKTLEPQMDTKKHKWRAEP